MFDLVKQVFRKSSTRKFENCKTIEKINQAEQRKILEKLFITSTMGPSVEVDINELQDLQKKSDPSCCKLAQWHNPGHAPSQRQQV